MDVTYMDFAYMDNIPKNAFKTVLGRSEAEKKQLFSFMGTPVVNP